MISYSDVLRSLISQTLVRQVLTSIGGAFITDGVLTSGQVNDTIGAIFVIGSTVWSLYNARHHAAMTTDAVNVSPAASK